MESGHSFLAFEYLKYHELRVILSTFNWRSKGKREILESRIKRLILKENISLVELIKQSLSEERAKVVMENIIVEDNMDTGVLPNQEEVSRRDNVGSNGGGPGIDDAGGVDYVHPEDSVSQISGRSRLSDRSNTSSVQRRMLLKAQIARAKAEQQAEDKIKMIRAEKAMKKRKMQEEMEEMDIRISDEERKGKMYIMEAELNALDEEMREDKSFVSKSKLSFTDPIEKRKEILRSSDRKPDLLSSEANSEDIQCGLMEAFMKCTLRAQLPKQELEKFGGDVAKYQIFKGIFKGQIEEKQPNDTEKLNYLYQYTRERPHKIVETCLTMGAKKGYATAWELLEKEYGNTEKIGLEYVERLLAREQLNRDDATGLRDYHMDLLMAKNVVSGLPSGSAELQNFKTLKVLVEKLPYALQDKWRFKVVKIWEDYKRNANFDDLLKLVETAANAANHPLYGKHTSLVKSRNPILDRKDGRRVNWGTAEELKCHECSGKHELHDCSHFQSLSVSARMEVLRRHRLCYLCFSGGHSIRQCLSQIRCRKCGGKHNGLLHGYVYKQETKTNTERNGDFRPQAKLRGDAQEFVPNENNQNSAVMSSVMDERKRDCGGLAAVPVIMKGKMKCSKTIAFMDTGSAVSFCTTSSLIEDMGLSAEVRPVLLRVTTMTGERDMNCGLISGMIACDISKISAVQLPPLYVIDSLPVSARDLMHGSELNKYDNIRQINLPDVTGVVGLMLGSNAVAAMEPLEISGASTPGEPYAVRTRLGWVAYGGSRRAVGSVGVGRISVRDRELNKLVEMAFDGGVEDLGDTGTGDSIEDQEWLGIVNSRCRRVAGKFEIPLPLMNEKVILPNSRKLAMSRVMGLRKKLQKNLNLKMLYCEFMKKMMDEGYMEEAEERGDGKWYIPHFGVEQASKPNKVRVVFDCAAKVAGISLNDILFEGPDLNNKLLDVLLKFREGKFAYMTDIEAMFYQVKVPETDRDYLRFFWWHDDDLEGEPREYRMTVHLFGACSSPSVATYALRRIALRDEIFSRDIRDTILDNFYVDDCLKAGDIESELADNCFLK